MERRVERTREMTARITKVGTAFNPSHRPKLVREHTIWAAKCTCRRRATPSNSSCRTSHCHGIVKFSAGALVAYAPTNADDLKACSTIAVNSLLPRAGTQSSMDGEQNLRQTQQNHFPGVGKTYQKSFRALQTFRPGLTHGRLEGSLRKLGTTLSLHCTGNGEAEQRRGGITCENLYLGCDQPLKPSTTICHSSSNHSGM